MLVGAINHEEALVGAFSEIVKLHLAGVAVHMEGLLVAGDDLDPWPRLLPGAGEAVEGEAAAGALVGVVAVVAGPAHSLVLRLHVLRPLQTLPAPPAPDTRPDCYPPVFILHSYLKHSGCSLLSL